MQRAAGDRGARNAGFRGASAAAAASARTLVLACARLTNLIPHAIRVMNTAPVSEPPTLMTDGMTALR